MRCGATWRDWGIAVDVLVNCAGLGHTAPFDAQRLEAVRAMLDVNVRALVELTHAFLPGMRERGRGRIVNVASNAAFQPVPYLTVYAATKSFVLSFSEGLAEELRGTGVRVQALCPGITATEFLDVAETHRGLLVTRMPTRMTAEDVVPRASAASASIQPAGAVSDVQCARWPTAWVSSRCSASPRAASPRILSGVAGELVPAPWGAAKG